jgi:DNA-binding cell septation regulator SpoVG
VSASVTIADLHFTKAPEDATRTGLLGWVGFVLDDTLVIESVAVRRTRAGRLVLSFPRRADRHGNARYDVRPLNSAAREAIENGVFAALGIKAEDHAS